MNKTNRTELVQARLSKEEKNRVYKYASGIGVSLSAYIRKSILKENIVSKTDLQTVFELRKIGVNLNQLSKHINTLPTDDNKQYALDQIKLYTEQLDKIIKSIL